MRHFTKLSMAVVSFIAILWCAPAFGQNGEENPERENGPNGGAFSFESFNIVHKNNIFDPNRRPNRPQAPRQRRPERPRPQTQHIDLLGVMIDEEKAVAFFECSNSEFTGPCEQGQEVAGFFLMEVYPGGVTLKENTAAETPDALEQTVLPVGSRLNKLGEEEWQVIDAPLRPISRRSLTSLASSRSSRGGRGRGNDRGRSNNRGRDAMEQIRQAMRSGGMGEMMRGMMAGRGGGGRGGGRGGGDRWNNTQVRSYTFDAGGGQAVYAIRGGDIAIDLARTER